MRFVFDIDGTLCFDGRLIDQTIIDTLHINWRKWCYDFTAIKDFCYQTNSY